MNLIETVDGEEPTQNEVAKIRHGFCLRCREPFNEDLHIIFTTTKKGLIWWHANFGVGKYQEEGCGLD